MLRTATAVALFVLCAASAQAQSVSSIFTGLPADFGHLFTLDSALILGATGGVSLPLHANDPAIAQRLYGDGEGAAREMLDPGNGIGDGAVQAGAALGIYVIGRFEHSPRVGTIGADLLRAQIVNGVLTQGLKNTIDRTRPDGGRHSFPSGHASATFATAAVLQRHLGWKAGLPAYALAGYVGMARMTSDHHFASDVMFGAGIGLIAGRAATFHVGRQDLTVSPALARGSIGISVAAR